MTLELFVQQMTWESDVVLGLTLVDVKGADLPPWEPGAHVGLHLPGGIRHYSLCGDPADATRYRVMVLREPASRGGSLFVHDQLRPGDVLHVDAPANHFEQLPATAYRFVAGGIGITPLLPMIRAAQSAGTPWNLLYVGGDRWTMAAHDEVTALPGPTTVVERARSARPDLAARLADPLEGELLYLCGPPGLTEAVQEAARAAGWPPGSVRSERFVPVELDAADAEGFTVTLARTGATFPVPADTALVDVLERNGIDVESACREGICGTCRIPVLAGVPRHRDAVLDEDERRSGTAIMACVSRAEGEIVLDL